MASSTFYPDFETTTKKKLAVGGDGEDRDRPTMNRPDMNRPDWQPPYYGNFNNYYYIC